MSETKTKTAAATSVDCKTAGGSSALSKLLNDVDAGNAASVTKNIIRKSVGDGIFKFRGKFSIYALVGALTGAESVMVTAHLLSQGNDIGTVFVDGERVVELPWKKDYASGVLKFRIRNGWFQAATDYQPSNREPLTVSVPWTDIASLLPQSGPTRKTLKALAVSNPRLGGGIGGGVGTGVGFYAIKETQFSIFNVVGSFYLKTTSGIPSDDSFVNITIYITGMLTPVVEGALVYASQMPFTLKAPKPVGPVQSFSVKVALNPRTQYLFFLGDPAVTVANSTQPFPVDNSTVALYPA